MLARLALIAEFTVGGRDAFMQDRMMQEAVIRGLEIIGEASRNLSEDLRAAHPEVPWRQIAAFRNFVIHVYWDIKLERIWEVVENDLPTLKPQLEAILASLPPTDDESDDA
ncbi:MAG: DUF86 domain-containing protein [Anaerolineaceae bacterium]|nr:MAG: DUF86 domain-containing protein [Anaerolineaceae bacterium]